MNVNNGNANDGHCNKQKTRSDGGNSRYNIWRSEKETTHPFWTVDLEDYYYVKKVVVTAPDNGITNNYRVYVGDSRNHNENKGCEGKYDGTKTVTCKLSGRYVTVESHSEGSFGLCEVEVYSE